MNYTILDILEKLINIEEDALKIYIQISETAQNNSLRISVVAKTIAKQEQKHIQYYKNLMHAWDDKLTEPIDFYLYDKAAKLLFEFINNIQLPQINSVKQLLRFALEFERSNIGLLLDIQGRLLEKIDDVNNDIYKVISIIIKEEQEHEKVFMDLLGNSQ
ncbi:ferritin family protein [Clostridium thailandense]|uniref:Rubrerythrin family protein n=1 Tax=Clostridium thailandense TaxID=2794346 RepID=A0A949TUP5_9CLOT|nr:ferritin family protein [Clostridium thailandense]MBV7271750.1 rubrerythrin family protein [Clostridium thailandense]